MLSGNRVFTNQLGLLRGKQFLIRHLKIVRHDGTRRHWSVVADKGQLAGQRELPPKAPGKSLDSQRDNPAVQGRNRPGQVIKLRETVVGCSNEDFRGDLK